MMKKKISKISVPLDESENPIRGLEMVITLARRYGVTLTGIYSIYAPPYSEFKNVGSVGKYLNAKIKKFMEESKLLLQKKVLCLMKELPEKKLVMTSLN